MPTFDVTGQLFVRETNSIAPDGRKRYILCGIVAVPADTEMPCEKQVTVVGKDLKAEALQLTLLLDDVQDPKDLGHDIRGCSPSHLLIMPIWRT